MRMVRTDGQLTRDRRCLTSDRSEDGEFSRLVVGL